MNFNYSNMCSIKSNHQCWSGVLHKKKELPGLSESFKVDGWVVKVCGQSRYILFKNSICKEMLSRVADTNQKRGDFRWQPATFDNPNY